MRALRRDELDVVIGWAADEGWDPGLADAESFWNTDPGAFVGFDRDGELSGAGSIVSYGGEMGFMGLFIVRPELRGRGFGGELWVERVEALQRRLAPGAPIGLEGVVEMEPFYARGGFVTRHGTARMQVQGAAGRADPSLVPLAEVGFEDLVVYDAPLFGARRDRFIAGWLTPAGGAGFAATGEEGALRGYGVLRPTGLGFKIGPLFADEPEIAARLLDALLASAAGAVVSLDVPEVNDAAIELAAARGMSEVFRCSRMWVGEPPPIPWHRVFGITTLELG